MNTTKNNFLIDKQTAINILHTCLPGIPLKRLNEIFAAMPPAQSERKKGKWIKTDKHDIYYQPGYKCSVCGVLTTCHGGYCPNCGADMRERRTDETD